MLKLSIIVPIYNVEPYLRKCVDSLLSQDLPKDEYEIILVDDGSTDGSGALADELTQSEVSGQPSEIRNNQSQITNHKSQIIKVLHQPNGGLSAARNSGLKVAQGKYVQFVDSDDYLEPNVLGGLVAQMERENLDVLRFDYQNVRIVPTNRAELYNPSKALQSEQSSTIRTCGATGNEVDSSASSTYQVFEPNKTPRNIDKRTDVVDGITYLNERMGYACYAVMYMVKRSLLVSDPQSVVSSPESQITNNQSPILFTEGIHFEDVDWTPRMLLAAKRVNSTTTIVYNYLLREGSITKVGKNVEKKRKNLADRMLILQKLGKLHCQYPQCVWLKRMQSSMVVGVLTSIASDFYADRKVYIRRIRQMQVLPLCIANQGRTYQRRAKVINIHPCLFVILYHFLHAN